MVTKTYKERNDQVKLGVDPEGCKYWFAHVDYENQQILLDGGWEYFNEADIKSKPSN